MQQRYLNVQIYSSTAWGRLQILLVLLLKQKQDYKRDLILVLEYIKG